MKTLAALLASLALTACTAAAPRSAPPPQVVGAAEGTLVPLGQAVQVGSLVVTPLGIMFESAKGLWVISRAMQTDYVGAGVEALFSGPVRGAHVAPRTTQVRFATEEQIFVFDYQVGQWSTFDLDATSAAVWLGQYVYVDREGYVLAESPLGYQDGDGSAYGIQVQIGPLCLDGVQGYGAVRHAVMLFEADGGSIEVQTLDDYGPSAVQVVSHALTPADGLAQVQHFFRHPKTSAVGMVITETDPIIGPFALVGLDLVVGVKGGTKRIPANQRMG